MLVLLVARYLLILGRSVLFTRMIYPADKIAAGPTYIPLAVKILWVALPPHYKLGSNAVIPLNKEDN